MRLEGALSMPDYELRLVTTDGDWCAYHDIRRRVLFEARGRLGVYDENGPDERASGNHPMVPVLGGEVIGTVRIDIEDEVATFRLVAIVEDRQRQGHGRAMQAQAEAFAAKRGVRELIVNSALDAIGFYARLGYVPAPGGDADHPRMRKAVGL